jgi:Nickel responsive protein SCO4226-like
MTLRVENGYVAECYWSGVSERDLRDLDDRAGRSVAELVSRGEEVRYLGSILMPDDEVVLCLFEGSAEAVRRAAEHAEIPFERLVEDVHLVHPTGGTP